MMTKDIILYYIIRSHLLHICYTSTDATKQSARLLQLDFSEAVDLIKHNILLQKLASFDVPIILYEVDRQFP